MTQRTTDIQDNKDKLSDIAKSGNNGSYGGAGVKNSNDILDQGLPGLPYLSDFLPVYAKVNLQFRSGDQEQAVKDMGTVYRRYDEQRDIAFDKFADEAGKLDKQAGAVRDASGDMGTQLSTLFEHWTGAAADGAQSSYKTFDSDTNDNVVAGLNAAAKAVRTAEAAVARAVTNKANSTLLILHASDANYSNGMLAGKTKDQWTLTVDIANGASDLPSLLAAAQVWGVSISTDCGELTADTINAIQQKAQQVTTSILVKTISDDWAAFMKLCDTTKSSVDKLWKTLTDTVSQVPGQPYSAQPASPDDQSPQTPQDSTNPQSAPPTTTGTHETSQAPVATPTPDNQPPPTTDPSSDAGSPPAQSPDPSGVGGGSPSPSGNPSDPPAQPPDLSGVGGGTPGPSGSSTDPAAQPPDLSGVGGGTPGPSGSPTDPAADNAQPPPDLSGVGSGAPSPSTGGQPPDLSGIGGGVPPATDPSSVSTSAPPPSSAPKHSAAPPAQPDLSGVGTNLPTPSGSGGQPKHSGPPANPKAVQKVPLPGGGSATVGKADGHGHQLLTIHQPDGHTKQYELDFGGKGDADPKIPGVSTIHPDAQGQLVVHDGNKTLTLGKPGPEGAHQVTVHGPGGAHHYHLTPPRSGPDAPGLKLPDPVAPSSGGADVAAPDLDTPGTDPSSAALPIGADAGGAPALPGGGAADGGSSVPLSPGGISGAGQQAASMSPVTANGAGAQPQNSGSSGGMGMAPGGGAQGKGGGDAERKPNKWGMVGNLFEDLSTDRSDRMRDFLEARPREKRE